MAVYYKWIKGCEPNSTLDSGLWSYISWGKEKTDSDSEIVQMPTLEVSTVGRNDTNNKDGAIRKSYGYFLTNEIPTPTIKNEWVFSNSLKVGGESTNSYFHGSFDFDGDVKFSRDSAVQFKNRITLYDEDNDVSVYLCGDDHLQVEGSLKVDGTLTMYDNLTVGTEKNPANITSYGYCQASYFNATSDKRAKENIQPADFSALDIVKKLQVYTFNYKNNPSVVPGLIAQDLLEADLPLELVNNKNASGEKDDYMSIRESKLIYILWKAIQEQQAEIEALKKQLKI